MTAQFHEKIILNGEHTSMASCPPLPEDAIPAFFLPAEEKARSGLVHCTACWRGYISTWEIRAGRLYLVGLEGAFKLLEGQFLFADRVSGTLHVPEGEVLQYVHMGFQSVYEQEHLIQIENGLVTSMTSLDNRTEKRHGPRAWLGKRNHRKK